MTEKVHDIAAVVDDEILSMEDIANTPTPTQYVLVSVEKFGLKGKIRLGSLTTDELTEWQEATDDRTKKTAGIRLLLKSIVDKEGNRTGSDKYIETMKKKSAGMVNHLVDRVLELNYLTTKQQQQIKND